jgi:hypothetical protein
MNVRWTADGWFVYDWTDAAIAHPFVELASPLSYDSGAVAASRARAFGSVWAEVMPESAVRKALDIASVIGPAYQAWNYRSIIDGIEKSGQDQASAEQMTVLLHYWVTTLVDVLRR